jgi:hypothetical protein
MRVTKRIKSIVKIINTKLGAKVINLTSGVKILCNGFKGVKGTEYEQITTENQIESCRHIYNILNDANKTTGYNDRTITDAVQRLCDGYEESDFLYSFGAVSDTHIQYGGEEANGEPNGVNDFKRALKYFNDKVDFICVCGDLVAYASQDFMDQYRDVITNTTLTDKPIYECSGNHETYPLSGKPGNINQTLWETTTGWSEHVINGCIGESLYYYFEHGGDIFIMLSMISDAPSVTFADGALDWLEAVLENNQNKRCFIFQHAHDQNDSVADPSHVYSNILDGEHGAKFLNLIKHYKNTIWFHGHTHLSISTGLDTKGYIADEYEYAPISTNLGYKSVHIPSLQGVRYYNPTINDLVPSYKYYGTDGGTYETQGGQHAEGYIVDVYTNKIVIRGINFAELHFDASWNAYYKVKPFYERVYVLDAPIPTIG